MVKCKVSNTEILEQSAFTLAKQLANTQPCPGRQLYVSHVLQQPKLTFSSLMFARAEATSESRVSPPGLGADG